MAKNGRADPSSEGRHIIQPATPENEESVEKEKDATHVARHPHGLSEQEHYGARSGAHREEGKEPSKRPDEPGPAGTKKG